MNSTSYSENFLTVDINICSGWKNEIPNLFFENALGSHLILDFYNCHTQNMSNASLIQDVFRKAALKSNCTVVAECYHTFEPHGVSGVTVISESHFTYHGWDESRYAAIDLFYCGAQVQIQNAIEILVDFFEPEQIKVYNFPRGLKNKFT